MRAHRDHVGLAAFEKTARAKQMDDNFDLAYRLMSSKKAREAFDLDKEPEAVKRALSHV